MRFYLHTGQPVARHRPPQRIYVLTLRTWPYVAPLVFSSGACALVCLWLAGCAAIGSREAILEGVDPARVELESTPFFPQSDYQCGPAALATVLAADGVDVTADQLVSEVYLPGRRGSLQVALIAATRARGRLPYTLPPQGDTL